MATRHCVLLTYALTNAVLYSLLLPLWEGFDEPFHFGYVQFIANGNGFPDPRTSRLSQEVGASLLLAPASLPVQRNLPEVTSYEEFFRWPEAMRQQAHQQLWRIDPSLRRVPSELVDYEAQQAPLAYAALALPERALANVPLPNRVLALRIIAGTLGGLLLFFGAERLGAQLGVTDPYKAMAVFCAVSSQMLWATIAHVANDWLAVPLAVWLLVAVIHYGEGPSLGRAAFASGVLSMGLLTKAYFIALIPLVLLVCVFRRRWRDLGIALAVTTVLAGPWYARNVVRYGTISAMQELREGVNPAEALRAIRLERLPAAIDECARNALWTGNNTFRSFSMNTLRAVMVVWTAALALWIATEHRPADWIVLLYAGLFILALAYDTAINYVASHGEATGPCPWYTQTFLVPLLALCFKGTSRSPRAGKVAAVVLMLLFGYVLVATYWVKLIPLYSGFYGRTSLASVTMLYGERLSMLTARLNAVCLVPAGMILFLAGLVTSLAVSQQVVFVIELVLDRAPQNIDLVQHWPV